MRHSGVVFIYLFIFPIVTVKVAQQPETDRNQVCPFNKSLFDIRTFKTLDIAHLSSCVTVSHSSSDLCTFTFVVSHFLQMTLNQAVKMLLMYQNKDLQERYSTVVVLLNTNRSR